MWCDAFEVEEDEEEEAEEEGGRWTVDGWRGTEEGGRGTVTRKNKIKKKMKKNKLSIFISLVKIYGLSLKNT